MQIKLGTWVAGRKDAPEGTVQWAGGYTDFSQAPFNGYYKSVTVEDYMNGAKSAGKYVYGDMTGTYQSIKIEQGDGKTDGAQSSSAKPSATDSSKSAASTLQTVTSSASFTASVTEGITLATGSPSSDNSSSSSGTTGGSSSSGSSSSSSSSSSSAPSESVVTAGASTKSGINFAFLGAAMFALLSL